MGRKVLAVSADRKIEAFMKAAGLGVWVCSPDDSDGITSSIQNLESQLTPAAFVDQTRQANASAAKKIIEITAERREKEKFQ